jgi:hypothetical protein
VVTSDSTVVVLFTNGPLTGTLRVSLKEQTIEVDWDVAFHGIGRLLAFERRSHLIACTDQALRRLTAPEPAVL